MGRNDRKLKKLHRREHSRYGADWERKWNKEIKETDRKNAQQKQTEKPKSD